jgi:hypothetical protein
METMHARITEHLPAVRALVSGPRTLVTGTQKRAIGQNDRRGRHGSVELGNGDGHLGRLHQEVHVAKPQGLAGKQACFRHGFAIDKSAVGGIAIPHSHVPVTENDVAVVSGNGGVLNPEVVLGATAKPIRAHLELNDLVIKAC